MNRLRKYFDIIFVDFVLEKFNISCIHIFVLSRKNKKDTLMSDYLKQCKILYHILRYHICLLKDIGFQICNECSDYFCSLYSKWAAVWKNTDKEWMNPTAPDFNHDFVCVTDYPFYICEINKSWTQWSKNNHLSIMSRLNLHFQQWNDTTFFLEVAWWITRLI